MMPPILALILDLSPRERYDLRADELGEALVKAACYYEHRLAASERLRNGVAAN